MRLSNLWTFVAPTLHCDFSTTETAVRRYPHRWLEKLRAAFILQSHYLPEFSANALWQVGLWGLLDEIKVADIGQRARSQLCLIKMAKQISVFVATKSGWGTSVHCAELRWGWLMSSITISGSRRSTSTFGTEIKDWSKDIWGFVDFMPIVMTCLHRIAQERGRLCCMKLPSQHPTNAQTSSSTVSLNSRSTFCPCSSVVDSPWRLRRAPRSNFGAFNNLTFRMWTYAQLAWQVDRTQLHTKWRTFCNG